MTYRFPDHLYTPVRDSDLIWLNAPPAPKNDNHSVNPDKRVNVVIVHHYHSDVCHHNEVKNRCIICNPPPPRVCMQPVNAVVIPTPVPAYPVPMFRRCEPSVFYLTPRY